MSFESCIITAFTVDVERSIVIIMSVGGWENAAAQNASANTKANKVFFIFVSFELLSLYYCRR